MQSRSAELIAVNNCKSPVSQSTLGLHTGMRYIFSAGASALTLPVANSIGWGPTMSIAAGISVSMGYVLTTSL